MAERDEHADELGRLRARVRELEDAESRFRIMADTAPVMIWMAGTDTSCDFFNQPWLAFTGRTMAQEQGDGWAEGVHPDDLRRCLEIYLSSFHARRGFRMEYRLRRHDGEYRWLLDSGTPRYQPDGTFAGYIGSCIDITEQKALAARALHAQKLEIIGRLAGGMAHDFNNILTGVDGFVELAQRALPPSSSTHADLLLVRRAAKRGTDLTRQLLAFGHPAIPNAQIVDLGHLVRELCPMLATLLGERITLGVEVSERAYVHADPSQLEQVIVNLALNARDATRGRGGALTLSVAELELDADFVADAARPTPGPNIVLEVRDDGCGMDATTRARLFEPFFSTKPVGHGTGLGLAVVLGIVEQSRGCITVASAPGVGTTFRIHLPRATTPPSPRAQPTVAPGRETILLVEDDELVRAYMLRVLTSAGYDVLAASSGAEALARVGARARIHLVVADVVMPGMGGRALAEQLAAIDPTTRVVYMSGFADDELVQQSLAGRPLDFLQKPFNAPTLLERVRAALDRD